MESVGSGPSLPMVQGGRWAPSSGRADGVVNEPQFRELMGLIGFNEATEEQVSADFSPERIDKFL